MISIATVLSFVLSFVAVAYVTHRFLQYREKKRLERLIEIEENLPTEVPTTCPKCGADEWCSPSHHSRLSSLDLPEHLSYMCLNCSGRLMVAPRDQAA